MILIGADFVPTESNVELFCSGDAEELFGNELVSFLRQADYRIFNLETPLCDELCPIDKCGNNFSAPTGSVNGYCAAGADLLTLANNHILDQAEQGLASTCRVLDKHSISYIGVGNTLKEASTPHIFAFHGSKIGVYACAEHEFSIAEVNCAGANPFDPLYSPDQVSELKKNCDYVIVLYHGGKEHYQYPSPQLQKTCRRFVEKGADLVVCQHSHCIGCEEKYLNGTIVYGQGNFLFDNSKRELWKTSLLIGIEKDFSVSYFPLVKANNAVRLANGEQKNRIIEDFERRSKEITEDGFVEQSYERFADESVQSYLISLRGKISLPFRIVNKLLGYRLNSLILKHYGANESLNLRNYIECESIREMLVTGLKRRNKQCR